MRQIVLTSFSQDTDLVSKTATAYLKFNNGELVIPISQEALTEVVQFMTGITVPKTASYKHEEEQSWIPDSLATDRQIEEYSRGSENPVTDIKSLLNQYRNMDQLNTPPPTHMKKVEEEPQYRNPFEGPNIYHSQDYDEDTGGVVDEDGFSQF